MISAKLLFNRLTFITVFISSICNGQSNYNLIQNGGFEIGFPYPMLASQANGLSNWQSETTIAGPNVQTHSPDWYWSSTWDPGNYTAHSGFGKLGMGNYELIQQPVNLLDDTWYNINFYLNIASPSFSSSYAGSTLKIYLAKNSVSYKSNSLGCTSDYVTFNDPIGQDIIQVAEIPITQSVLGYGVWNEIKKAFKSPLNGHNYDYIVFDVRSNNYQVIGCSDSYILLDDISLFPLCSNFCATDLPPITHSALPDGMIANNLNERFKVLITNAMSVEFKVWYVNTGQLIYEFNSFDVNGLKNPGYPDYLLEWNGVMDGGTTLLQQVYLAYGIKLWSCSSGTIVHWGMPLLYFPPVNPPGFPIFEYYFNELEACCPLTRVINNFTYPTGFSREDVSSSLIAGNFGPVIVPFGSSVKYHSADELILGPFFDIQPGANFEAQIVPCGTQRYSQPSGPERLNYDFDTMTSLNLNNSQILPNPNNGSFTYISSKKHSEEYILDVIDCQGKLCHSQRCYKSNNQNSVTLPEKVVSGIYFMRLQSERFVEYFKFNLIR